MNQPTVSEWGLTEQKIIRSSYTWRIKNFSYINKPAGERLESPTFCAKWCNNAVTWYLALYPSGVNANYKEFISASLCNKSESPKESTMEVDFTICILDKKNGIVHKKSKKSQMKPNSFDGFNEFLEKSTLVAEAINMLPSDVLTIFCEFTVIQDIVGYSMQEVNNFAKPAENRKILADDIERQFEADQFHDFVIIAPCGTRLHAHKFMLAARSPVFGAMFTVDKEKAINVKTEDIIYDALKEMLRFIYTGKVGRLETCIIEVLIAAEKYKIAGLKNECSEYLYKTLNIENCVDTLTYCHRFQMNNLKPVVCRFIISHAKNVVNTEAFKSIDDDDLFTDIMQVLSLEP